MKIFNKYTYLLIGILTTIAVGLFIIIPNFQTEEFDEEVIEDIVKGVTTTTIATNNQEKVDEQFSSGDESFDNILKPELRIYNQPKIITSEADIKVTFLKDNFITINNVKNEDYFNVRYLIKPYMLWIWVSVLLITIGGLMSLFNKKYEK